MFVVVYDLRAMPAGHQTFLRQRTFSVPVRRDTHSQTSRKPLSPGQGRTLRYLVHLRCVHSIFPSFCWGMVHTRNEWQFLKILITLCFPSPVRFQSSKSGKIYLHRDIRLLFSRKSMEVDSGAAYELQSSTESPMDPPFSPRCWGRTPPSSSRPLLKLKSHPKARHGLLLSPG